MELKENSNYTKFVLFHIIIGVLIYLLPFVSKIYAIGIIVFGVKYIVKNKNSNNEALYAAAYIVGAEVLLRMTQGNFFEQYAKYGVVGMLLIGMLYKGFSKKSFIYWIFALLLLPGVVLSFYTLNFETDIRKAITFNIIGPISLAFCAIYCYQKKVNKQQMLKIIDMIAYPIIATVVYMFLYTPSIKDVVTNTESNFETSGGYGPNQVSTILGLGIFLFFTKIIMGSKSNRIFIINVLLLLVVTFRGIVTFSRGGVITGGVMIFLLIIMLWKHTNLNAKFKIATFVLIASFSLIGVWTYSSIQTGGLIDKRYANQDARGREKESKLTGRERLIESEINMFLDNPIFGIGVGKNKEYRESESGILAASHNEITRMLAEHGSFGLIDLIILFITPILLYTNNKQNIFLFSFLIFWLLTINHAAMRLVAPAFIYALSLLKVSIIDE
jgi:hypothetical protein